MQKKLIYFNKKKFTDEMSNINFWKEQIQKVINDFNLLISQTSNKITYDELKDFFTDGDVSHPDRESIEKLIFCKYSGNKKTKLFGLEIDTQAAMKLLKLPDLDEFYKLVDNLPSRAGLNWNNYELISNTLEVKKNIAKKIEERYKEYATSDDEIQRLDDVQEIADIINNFIEKYKVNRFNVPNITTKSLLSWLEDDYKFAPRIYFVKYGELPTDFRIPGSAEVLKKGYSGSDPTHKKEPDNKTSSMIIASVFHDDDTDEDTDDKVSDQGPAIKGKISGK